MRARNSKSLKVHTTGGLKGNVPDPKNPGKILICHYPASGNPVTISISPAGLAAHQGHSNDADGACVLTCPPVSVVDCMGVCNGPAVKDCAGVCNGKAVQDCAGVCNGTAVRDCKGVCGGTSVKDCQGICGGAATLDCAGVCDGSSVLDCNGVCNGSAYLDCCGQCVKAKINVNSGSGAKIVSRRHRK